MERKTYKVNGRNIFVMDNNKINKAYHLSLAEINQLRIFVLEELEKEIDNKLLKIEKIAKQIDCLSNYSEHFSAVDDFTTIFKNPLLVVQSQRSPFDYAKELLKYLQGLTLKEENFKSIYKFVINSLKEKEKQKNEEVWFAQY
jgi:hypothetical protein